ncbi:MAG: glycosyltransferase involved in cell wall biosynthesis [Alphaproteobacteria bacterium]|jgi:glycosyltransferase involved in cell wall biosynthesis
MNNNFNQNISVIVPIKNEAENITALIHEINHALVLEVDFQIIYVNDGSTDNSLEVLKTLKQSMPHLFIVNHKIVCGQSAAIHSGVQCARHNIIVTLDGDGQNIPANIPMLVSMLRQAQPNVAMVAGQRKIRHDRVSKKYASFIANKIRKSILQDGVDDTGCGLKVFRRDAYLKLPYFNHMHRYFAALFQREHYQVLLADVGHRHRRAGRSKYGNWDRFAAGIFDLLGVLWLMKRRKKASIIAEML